MSRIQSVHLQRFKRINDAPFDLHGVNVVVGANNSGKSSIIQGLHFGIGALQALHLSKGRIDEGGTSLNPSELIYTPSETAYALGYGGKLQETPDSAISVKLVLETGEECGIQIRKGRNRNIIVSVQNKNVANQLASLDKPFTIFSPGLAGIAKNENYISDGVLLRTLARGDANLVLRNILYRLWRKPEWSRFLDDLHQVFPGVEFNISYEPNTDEFIDVYIQVDSEPVPIELAGTGVLQATQILSYIHRFGPSLVVLDEPDSHLHPNNQRLLCSLLRTIADERRTQILLTTHSRHVVDALGTSAHLLWVRNATVDVATPDDEIGILLDIGALDIKERVAVKGTKVIVLTEDEITRRLEVLLESSGFKMGATVVLPYYGATSPKNLRPLVKMIQGTKASARIVVHRDRDFLSDSQISDWRSAVRKLGVEPFATNGTDIESYFVNVDYLAESNQKTQDEFNQIFEVAANDRHDRLVAAYVNGHINVARQNGDLGRLNPGQLAADAPKDLRANPLRYRHGKIMLAGIRDEYRNRYDENLKDTLVSKVICDPELKTIAKKIFGNG